MNPSDTQPGCNSTARIVPTHMAHFVLRSARYRDVVAWYQQVLQAEIVFQNDQLTFITFDDEHHRAAIANTPDLPPKRGDTVGVDHIAYSYRNVSDLLHTYVRLKAAGILPFWCINHGPTTSIYYHDPEDNDVELQVDNYPHVAEAAAYFQSEAFAHNPLGVEFDPDVLVRLWQAGMSDATLCRQGIAPRGNAPAK